MRRLSLLFVAGLMALAAAPAPAQEAGGETLVETRDNVFEPRDLMVDRGATVVFKNTGQLPHTATASDKSFDTGNIAPGESKSVTVDKLGKIDYICVYHETIGMVGSLEVQAAAGEPGAAPSPAPANAPVEASPPPEDVEGSPPPAQQKLGIDAIEPLETQPTERYFRPLAGAVVILSLLAIGAGYARSLRKARQS